MPTDQDRNRAIAKLNAAMERDLKAETAADEARADLKEAVREAREAGINLTDIRKHLLEGGHTASRDSVRVWAEAIEGGWTEWREKKTKKRN